MELTKLELLKALENFQISPLGKAISAQRSKEVLAQIETLRQPCPTQNDCLTMEFVKGIAAGLEIDPAANLIKELKAELKEIADDLEKS